MRYVVGHFMARGVRSPKCAALPLFMPQKKSRQRWSSQRLGSMKRPSTSSCTNPTTGGVQTMLCWRPQGALQDDLIIWMRTRSENESSEFVGSISNGLMTALTTTSDLSSVTCHPVSLILDSLCTTLVPYVTRRFFALL